MQLFPSDENDFFRNRLTHSLEVSQIATGIALDLNKNEESLAQSPIDIDLVSFSALAHDLGHPPFGHNGERALDRLMSNVGGFEANAQTLRILARLDKKELLDDASEAVADNTDSRLGLNLTYRTLASVLKYDSEIPRLLESRREEDRHKPVKGYYHCEAELVKDIRNHVISSQYRGELRTIECSIMDMADDIAYSTYDLEAGLFNALY
jgi:dGTPase